MREIIFRSAHYTYEDDKFSRFGYWGRIGIDKQPSKDSFTSPGQSSFTYIKTDEQFTGMTDKEGNKIFEGDIIENADGDLRLIVYSENSFLMNLMDGRKCNFSWYYSCKVVGNIHENPELLKPLE